MKKYKVTKIVISIAFVCIILGSICISVGITKGGNLKYLSLEEHHISWLPFYKNDKGMYINAENTTNRVPLGNELKSVNVKVDIGDVEVREGDSNAVILSNVKRKYLHLDEKDGNANIVIRYDKFYNYSKSEKIIIQLKNKEYKNVRVLSELGEINVYDIQSAKFQIIAKLGKIHMQGISSKDLYVDESSGDVKIQGMIRGNSIIKNRLGKIDVEVNGNQNDYRYTVKNALGRTNIQRQIFNGNANIVSGDSNAKNFLKINCSVGDVKVSFD